MSLSETTENITILFNDIYHFFKSQIDMREDKKNIEIKSINELSIHDSVFSTDFFRLRQILINIINNAIKFTDLGHIYFGVILQDNDTLLFYVEDTGIGIPTEKRDYIFAPFMQINNNKIWRQQSGTGLGLSIVRGLLKLMQGKVWLDSTVDKGTTFYFTLPLKQSPQAKLAKSKAVHENFDWKTKTILIVEDDNFNAQLMMEYLVKTKVEILQ